MKTSIMNAVFAVSILAISGIATATPTYFCESESGKTWLIVNDGEFKVVQDGDVLRYGNVVPTGCLESYPARCSVESRVGKVAHVSVGDTAQGTLYYTKGRRHYETPIWCSIHPYTRIEN